MLTLRVNQFGATRRDYKLAKERDDLVELLIIAKDDFNLEHNRIIQRQYAESQALIELYRQGQEEDCARNPVAVAPPALIVSTMNKEPPQQYGLYIRID